MGQARPKTEVLNKQWLQEQFNIDKNGQYVTENVWVAMRKKKYLSCMRGVLCGLNMLYFSIYLYM